jgi:hypothetical protein
MGCEQSSHVAHKYLARRVLSAGERHLEAELIHPIAPAYVT